MDNPGPPRQQPALVGRRVPLLVPLLCLAFVVGVLAVATLSEVSLETWRWMGLAAGGGGAAATLAALLRRSESALVFAALCAFGLGFWRAGTALDNPTPPWRDAPAGVVRAVATVDGQPEIRGPWAIATARIDRIERPEGHGLPPGRVQLTLGLPGPQAGDEIEIAGHLEPVNPHDPLGRRLLDKGISATSWFPQVTETGRRDSASPASALWRLRAAIDVTLRRLLPEPHAALLAGLLLGADSGMPEDFRRALRASGTTHLVVVSGYNISLVAGALLALSFGRRRAGAALALLGIWSFVVLSGAAAPSVRAALMGTVALFAIRTGRGTDALVALGLTGAAMLAVDPRLALDLGFQLSVLATLGLVTLQPRIAGLLTRVPGFLREPLAGTLGAQLATVPLLAATFHQLSVVAPLANLLAAPAIPVATIGGAIGVAVATMLPAIAGLCGALLTLPTGYLVAVIEATGRLPGATTPIGEVSPLLGALYAAVLIGWAAWSTPEGQAARAAVRSPRLARALVAGVAALAGVGLAATGVLASTQQPGLTFSVLDVGGGDAVLVRTAGGRTVLIDGGPSPAALLAQMGRRFGLAEKSLTVAVLTRADEQRLPGIVAAVERYGPELAIAPADAAPSALYARWRAAVGDRLLAADTALAVDLEPGLRLEALLTPPVAGSARGGDARQSSLVLRLIHGDRVFLVAPSLTSEVAHALRERGWDLAADVLVVPRYGDPAGGDARLVNAVRPIVAVVPASPRGRGQALSGPLEALGGIPTYRTETHGTVEVRSDGSRLHLKTDRTPP